MPDRHNDDRCKDSGLSLVGRDILVCLVSPSCVNETDFGGTEQVNAEGVMGQLPSWVEAEVSVCIGLGGGLEALGTLGVRGTRGVTGERQSSEGDDKKDVVNPEVKLSPKDLGRSMLI